MKTIKIILLIISCSPLLSSAQIHFEQGLSWQQIQQKAKTEHKYIFLDCFATWCGPCKKMDAETYPDTALGKFINPIFISVKMQMDTSKTDDKAAKAQYADAHLLMTENNVIAFPTFLFFSPEGKLVHKAVGYLYSVDFLRQALGATDRSQQEYGLLEKFDKGILPNATVPELIALLEKAGDKPAAKKVAQTYVHDYLMKLPDELLYKKENIRLIASYLKTSQDKAFDIFYKHADIADKATEKGYSEKVVAAIITKEEINKRLWSDAQYKKPINPKPDWAVISEAVNNKYGLVYLNKTLPSAKVTWYSQTKEWPELIETLVEVIETDPKDTQGNLELSSSYSCIALNNTLYNKFFMHATDKRALSKAVSWEKQIINKYPDDTDYLDTYAGLLYKCGKKEEAIEVENKAISVKQKELIAITANSPDRFVKQKELDELQNNLTQIKAGKPYWETVK